MTRPDPDFPARYRKLPVTVEASHTCDAGHFDRTICPEPCDSMHFYCSGCGARQDVCTHDVTAVPGQDLEMPPAEAVADALIRYETGGLCDCGKADETPEQTQTRDAMEMDRARAVLALIPPQRCAPSEDELAKAVTSGWVEGFDEFGKYGPQFDSALAARAVAKLYGDQPTVAQAKADALREAAMDWTDFDAAAMGTPAAWFRARAAAIEKGAHDG